MANKIVPIIPVIISFLEVLKSRTEAIEYPEFFYHQVLISEEEIFQTITDEDGKTYQIIKKVYFKTLYKNGLENTNLEDVNLFFQEIHDNITGANLNGTYLQIDATSVDISDALYDDTVLIHNFNERGYTSIHGPQRKRISKLHF